jgi:hypothetical protein
MKNLQNAIKHASPDDYDPNMKMMLNTMQTDTRRTTKTKSWVGMKNPYTKHQISPLVTQILP